MTISVPTAAPANEDDVKLDIVNPKNLYDPSPNGYSTAVIVPPPRLSWPTSPDRAARTAREPCRPISPSR